MQHYIRLIDVRESPIQAYFITRAAQRSRDNPRDKCPGNFDSTARVPTVLVLTVQSHHFQVLLGLIEIYIICQQGSPVLC